MPPLRADEVLEGDPAGGQRGAVSTDVREHRSAAPRGRLVEGVRLIFIALFGTAGFQIGTRIGPQNTAKTALFVFLGSAVGYVIGGMLGRVTARTVTGLERELRRTPAAEMAAGVAGLIIGLIVAALVTFPLLRLPSGAAWPAMVFVYLTLSSLGYRLGKAKRDELFGLVGVKPRAAGRSGSDVNVLDTSALIDGRIADLVSTGFVAGTFLVHSGVLRELQAIADSSDERRRTRGRRGLDVLAELQRSPTVEVVLVDEAGVNDVDAALVRLAKDRGASLVTVDANLAKVATAVSVPVRQVNELAAAFRVPYTPGDELTLHLVKPGREHDQAVGFLDDGTMVVVEHARSHIGENISAQVTNVIQTSTGRMVFASLARA
jgi:uncharacterized protein YacL